MIISDLDHLEVVRKEKSVEGGYANVYTFSYAFANGNNFAGTYSNAFTSSISSSSYLSYYSPGVFSTPY